MGMLNGFDSYGSQWTHFNQEFNAHWQPVYLPTQNLSPLAWILLDYTGFMVVLQFTVYLHQDKLGIQDFCVSDAEAFINHGYS